MSLCQSRWRVTVSDPESQGRSGRLCVPGTSDPLHLRGEYAEEGNGGD